MEPTDATNLTFGPEILRDPEQALRREWLVTNGLGGYASASVATANTRRYHGLLVAALAPPVGRAVLLSKLEETLRVTDADGVQTAWELSANLYPGAIYPQGYRNLSAWACYPAPTWKWQYDEGIHIEKRVWMAHGRNTTYLSYTLKDLPPDHTATLSLVPLLAWRDYHSEMTFCDTRPETTWRTGDTPAESGQTASLYITLPPVAKITSAPTTLALHVFVTGYVGEAEHPYANKNSAVSEAASFTASPDWYRHFQHPREQERGLDYQEDLYTPGALTIHLQAGKTLTIVATTETETVAAPQAAWEAHCQRQRDLLAAARSATQKNDAKEDVQGDPREDTFASQLTRAADQFVIQVPGKRSTIIAGYPWFGDWGRDTMIALPGLCLSTGRAEIAREILQSFAAFVDKGMLPNRFPDGDAPPEYNTVDATLWYFVALYRYVEATGDIGLLREGLWGVLKQIVDFHMQGTRYNIHVDAGDHLLFAGEAGVQLTWMDAKVGDWVVTPRIGKPVEINALWCSALWCMAHFAARLDDPSQSAYEAQARAARASFAARFVRADGQGLYDVLDTPDGGAHDSSIRPNQIFALSLPFAPLDPKSPDAQTVLRVVEAELLTPVGLRTLSPRDPAYRPRYEGDPWHRDGAYHQGAVWPWLLGPYVEAYSMATGDSSGALDRLRGLQSYLAVFGVGSLAEVFDGGEPQRPNGCVAQAWSIAETLRVWKWLSAAS